MLGTWHGVSEEGMSATVIAKPQTDCEALKGGAADTLYPLCPSQPSEQVSRWEGSSRCLRGGEGFTDSNTEGRGL